MPKFLINEGYGNEKTVESESFYEKDSFVVFANAAGKEKVYAIPTSAVYSIERKND